MTSCLVCSIIIDKRGHGGIGRHAGFRFQWETMQVRVLLSAPPKCQARDKKKFVSGLTIFLSFCPCAQIATQKSYTPIACPGRNKITEAGNPPLNLDPVIGMYQHLVNQKIDQLLPQLI